MTGFLARSVRSEFGSPTKNETKDDKGDEVSGSG